LNCFNGFTIIFLHRMNIAHKTDVMEKCGKGHTKYSHNDTDVSLFFLSWYLYLYALRFCFILFYSSRHYAILSYQSASNHFNLSKYDGLLQDNDALAIPQHQMRNSTKIVVSMTHSLFRSSIPHCVISP